MYISSATPNPMEYPTSVTPVLGNRSSFFMTFSKSSAKSLSELISLL